MIQGLAADPFDTRFHESGRYREHTILGLLLETYARSKLHPDECTAPLLTTLLVIENTLKIQCPDALEEIKNHVQP